MNLNDTDRFCALHEHYVDTFTSLKEHLQTRDRCFLLVVLLVTATLFEMYAPNQAGAALGQMITNRLSLGETLDVSFLGALIWFGLLASSVKYFQTVVHVDRQYIYLHSLEDQLAPVFDGKAFTREGQSYLKGYPCFSKWTAFLYSWMFPILLMCVSCAKMAIEYKDPDKATALFVVNVVMWLSLMISTILYLITAHPKRA
ncbi:MAG: hypothetical protein PHV36_06090 [Elusimicrobiales bacterium]|nr:hypothetical protein [Elusimicrobiales bacterium]